MTSRPLRVLCASCGATSCDTLVLLLLSWGLGLASGLATIAGCLVGGAVNFTLNRTWVFGARAGAWLTQLVRYGVVVVGGGALVSGAIVAVLDAAGVPLLVAKGVAVVLALVGWTYPMSARVVFARDEHALAVVR